MNYSEEENEETYWEKDDTSDIEFSTRRSFDEDMLMMMLSPEEALKCMKSL